MTIIDSAKMTTKGQITIPSQIRKLLHLEEGASVAFGLSKEGVVLMPCEVTARSPYTPREWDKINKLAAQKRKALVTPAAAKDHLAKL
jgi:AbrB family looped-hinge helix DNA binding protein